MLWSGSDLRIRLRCEGKVLGLGARVSRQGLVLGLGVRVRCKGLVLGLVFGFVSNILFG